MVEGGARGNHIEILISDFQQFSGKMGIPTAHKFQNKMVQVQDMASCDPIFMKETHANSILCPDKTVPIPKCVIEEAESGIPLDFKYSIKAIQGCNILKPAKISDNILTGVSPMYAEKRGHMKQCCSI